MSDPLDLPPEQQSAWQRWELASFGDNRPTALARAAADKAARAALTSQLSEQIAARYEQARSEGHAQGYADGLAAGNAAGLLEGRDEAMSERAQLHVLAESFATALGSANETIAADVLKLALDIAKAMLKNALAIRPELVLPVIDEALRYLPAVQQPARLVLNPQDALLVRAHAEAQLISAGWRIEEDAQLSRGGCRIETGSNQIDASTTTRWQRIAAALGVNDAWLTDAPPT